MSEQPVGTEKDRKASQQQQPQQTTKTEHVVHCQSCARKRSHLLDNFVVLNQYNLDELKNIYDQFQLYVPSIVGLINTNPSTTSSESHQMSAAVAAAAT